MAILDIILLLCFVPAIVAGISKGFIKQLVEVVALIAGAYVANRFASMVSTWLMQYLTFDQNTVRILSFIVIVIVVTVLLNLLGDLLTRVVKFMTLGFLNRMLGLIFAVLKIALILGIVIMLFEGINGEFHLVKDSVLDNAVVYQHLREFAGKVFPFLKTMITNVTNV